MSDELTEQQVLFVYDDLIAKHFTGDVVLAAAREIVSLRAERDRIVELAQRLRQEAQIHAQEMRSQRATVREIYQALTGSTGEPGDWNGAEPVRKLVAEREAELAMVTKSANLASDREQALGRAARRLMDVEKACVTSLDANAHATELIDARKALDDLLFAYHFNGETE